jgi:hypothetical protein
MFQTRFHFPVIHSFPWRNQYIIMFANRKGKIDSRIRVPPKPQDDKAAGELFQLLSIPFKLPRIRSLNRLSIPSEAFSHG